MPLLPHTSPRALRRRSSETARTMSGTQTARCCICLQNKRGRALTIEHFVATSSAKSVQRQVSESNKWARINSNVCLYLLPELKLDCVITFPLTTPPLVRQLHRFPRWRLAEALHPRR